MKYYYTLILILFISNNTLAQNEFYVKGDNSATTIEVYVKDSLVTMPTLYVKGSITNNQGVFVNSSAKMELTKDFTNTANGTAAYYESSGEERFSGNINANISGNLDGTSGNKNQLNKLVVNKTDATNYINLLNNVHSTTSGKVVFLGNGIIRTDNTSHSLTGADYTSYLKIQNTSPSAITGASLTAGTVNKFIEGKLRWIMDASQSYAFPIGGGDGDGVEPFGISLNTAAGLELEGYIRPSVITIDSAGVIYQDIGGMDSTASSNSLSSLPCIAASDGVLDQINLNTHCGNGWVVNKIAGTVTSYSIAFAPAPAHAITPYNPMTTDGDCANIDLVYVTKDAIPGGIGNPITAPAMPFTVGGHNVAPQSTLSLAGVTGYGLSTMSSFSEFGIHTTTASGSALPVEMLFFSAKAVNNEYIQLDWATASEINNLGFELQRSYNGVDFETITFIAGAGNSNQNIYYTYNDYNVEKNTYYYYRLKQIDYDGNSSYSIIQRAALEDIAQTSVNIYPNPSTSSEILNVEIGSVSTTDAYINVYDVVGQIVYHKTLTLQKGMNNTTIDKALLAAGQYYVAINIGDSIITNKINILQ